MFAVILKPEVLYFITSAELRDCRIFELAVISGAICRRKDMKLSCSREKLFHYLIMFY